LPRYSVQCLCGGFLSEAAFNPEALDINHDAAAHSKIHHAPLKPKKSKVPWTKEEDAKLLQMRNDGRSWEYIVANLPGRSKGTIQVRCSTKFKSNTAILCRRVSAILAVFV
jgi:hypothetical protein